MEKLSHEHSNSIILKHSKFHFRMNAACFDYDHTIVRPKNQKVFSNNLDDWEWFNKETKTIIQSYYNSGYCIVIFTNQNRKKDSIQFKIDQIRHVLNQLEIPYKAYILMDQPIKKPSEFSFVQFNSQNRVNRINSFYVGDALGRKNDWSDSDKEFAINCQLKYYSPEQIFSNKIEISNNNHVVIQPKDNQELVIMVGYPGSGKTTLVNKVFDENNQYQILHGDQLKTESKIKSKLTVYLDQGKSVVIDATNPSIKKRKVFIDIAKKNGIFCRIIAVSTSFDESLARNNQRDTVIPKIAYYVYRKNYQEPTIDEGADEIVFI